MTQSINIRREIFFFNFVHLCLKRTSEKRQQGLAVLLNVNVDLKDVRNIATSARTCHFYCRIKYVFLIQKCNLEASSSICLKSHAVASCEGLGNNGHWDVVLLRRLCCSFLPTTYFFFYFPMLFFVWVIAVSATSETVPEVTIAKVTCLTSSAQVLFLMALWTLHVFAWV